MFILISALVLFAPQYLWNSYFSAHFDFFFDLIKKLDRLMDTNTGEYSPQNFERVKKLEERFSKSQIFFFYKAKLVLQWITCVILFGCQRCLLQGRRLISELRSLACSIDLSLLHDMATNTHRLLSISSMSVVMLSESIQEMPFFQIVHLRCRP